MNEIEKLYELVGIKPLGTTDLREMKILVNGKVIVEGKDLPNNYYKDYPPFTAEKQLELIKWLGKYDYFEAYYRPIQKDWILGNKTADSSHYDFTLGLASWISDIWQDLTETEQEEVRKILKG